jgi:iron(II)-dependent oxidoreductase
MLREAEDGARQVLLSRLLAARAETDALFRTVRPEAMFDRPIPERNRIVFYIGHLEAFDWNLLDEMAGSHSEFDRLFAFGIDPIDGNLPTDVPRDWPCLEIVNDYRDQTRAQVDRLLATPSMLDGGDDVFRHKMNVAIEHRLMHAETLAYIFHQMPFERKQGSEGRGLPPRGAFAPESIPIPAGHATLGLPRDSPVFGWDNEFEQVTVRVPEFNVDKYKITNGQFLGFLEAGGYTDRSLWAPTDWEWRTTQDISHPVFWVRHKNGWDYRSMFEAIPLPLNQPVYVSHAEASAYARWVGKMLPTEAEWHRAASGAFGVQGLIAEGWEWTATEFAPLPGFQPMAFYPGYSEPFFDGRHCVLKGGSPRTAPVMLRPSFRNWFQPHYQYVYAGFRCVERSRI